MAVLAEVPGLEVTIRIDGVDLQEYEDDEEQEVAGGPIAEYQASRTITKYIESISDKEFAIQIKLLPGFPMTSATLETPIHIDGKLMITPVFQKISFPSSYRYDRVVQPITRSVTGISVLAPGNKDHDLLQKFKFAKIETCENLPLGLDIEVNSHV